MRETMVPVLASRPELILNDRAHCSPSGTLAFPPISPYYNQLLPADRPASQDELDPCELYEDVLLMICEIMIREQSCPLGAQAKMGESALLTAPAVAERLGRITSPDQQHVLPGLMDPIQDQESPCSLNYLPMVSPSLLNLQTLSPGVEVQPGLTPLSPELLCSSCSPQSHWLNMNLVSPSSDLGFSPYVLVPVCSPAEFWYSPYLPPSPWPLQPEVLRPGWCLCPPWTHSADMVSRRTAQQDSEQDFFVTPKKSKEEAKSKEQQRRNSTPDEAKLQENSRDNIKYKGTPGFLSFLDELLSEEAFEEYMRIMCSFCPKETETEEDECRETETLDLGSGSFLEYLDELCSDKDFVRKVGETLNVEYLDSLFSSDPEPLDLFRPEEQDQKMMLLQQLHRPSANNVPLTKQTPVATSRIKARPRSLFLDPQDTQCHTNPYRKGQNTQKNMGSKKGWRGCSPLLPSHLLEEPLPTPGGQANDPSPGEYYTPVPAWSPICHCGSFFMDDSFTSSLYSSPDTSLISDFEDDDVLVSLPAGMFFANTSDFTGLQSAQLSQRMPLHGGRPSSESPSTSSVFGSPEDPPSDRDPAFRALRDEPRINSRPIRLTWKRLPCLLLPEPAQMTKPEAQCSPKNVNPQSSCLADMTHAPNDILDFKIPTQAGLPFMADFHLESFNHSGDCKSSDLVPEKPTLQELQPPPSSSIRTGRERERKGNKNLRKGAETRATQKARDDLSTEKTREKAAEEKDEEAKISIILRRTQRRPGQSDKEKAKFIIVRAEERKPSDKSLKKTLKFTPEKDGVIYKKQKRRSTGGRRLCKREQSHWSPAATAEPALKTAAKEEHNKLPGETQEFKVDAGKQREADNPKFCTEMGVNKTLSSKTPKQESEEEAGQMSSVVRRRIRTATAEERASLTPATRRKTKCSERERTEVKGQKQDPGLENADETQPLPVSSPLKRCRGRRQEERSEKVNKDKVSVRAETHNHSSEDSTVDQGGKKAPREHPISSPTSPSESIQVTHKHTVVLETKTWNLRPRTPKPNVSKWELNKAGTPRRSNPKPRSHQTTAVKGEGKRPSGEDAGRPSLTLSPMKRRRDRCGASEERETGVINKPARSLRLRLMLSPMKKNKGDEQRGGEGRKQQGAKAKREPRWRSPQRLGETTAR